MSRFYRAMTHENDVPLVGAGKNMLGIRIPPDPNADIRPDDSGSAPAITANQPANFPDEVRALVAKCDWDALLKLIGEHESTLQRRDVAYARGICWAHLGIPNVAIEFLNEAARLRSLSANEESLLLTCYVQADRAAEVIGRAQEIRANPQHPVLLLKAAEIFSLTAEELSLENATKYRQAAIDCAESAVASPMETSFASDSQEFHSIILSGLLHLALNYEQMGNRDKAVEACRKALKISPEDLDALMLYGFLVFENFPDASRTDFIQGRRDHFIGESFNRLLANPGFSPLSHEGN